MNVTVRPLAEFPAHVDEIASWVHEEWKNVVNVSKAETTARLLHPANCPNSLIALSDGVPVGVIGFRRFMRLGQDSEDLFVNVLFVQKKVRRRGIGRALLKEALCLAASRVSVLFVYTDVRSWYEKSGWQHSPDCECEGGSCVLYYDLNGHR